MTEAIKNTEGASRSRKENSQPLLSVYTFGTFRLAWHIGSSTPETAWNSRTSARALFKLLLCAPGRQAPKSVLAGILWPETDEERARESLRSAYKVLRKILRTASGEELLVLRSTDDMLQLAEQTRLWVDADAFEELVSRASHASSPDIALSLWQEANALLRGEFLADDQHCEWARHKIVKRRRQVVWMARCRMIRHLADLYVQQGQISLAEETLEAHVAHFPTDQDALYRLLVLLEQQGCFEQASILYERTCRALEGLGKQPAPHVRACHERFRQSIIALPSTNILLPNVPVTSPGMPQRNAAVLEQGMTHISNNPLSLPKTTKPFKSSLDVLRILIDAEKEGEENMSLFSRRQLLELGIAALISHLAQFNSKRISAIERDTLSRALSESIIHSWKQLFSLENAQVVAIGQMQLSLIHQAHTLVYPSALPYLYAGAHSLVGIGLHFQERDREALQAHHHGYMASLATGDPWYVAQSLISQADAYLTLGMYTEASHVIEEGLSGLGEIDEAHRRARAHLLGCWADVAMMMSEYSLAQKKLDEAALFLDEAMIVEEFDHVCWRQLSGKKAIREGNYQLAIDHLEAALAANPPDWSLRQAGILTPLAIAYARKQEREKSLAIAQQAIPVIGSINASMTNKHFLKYVKNDLLSRYPHDREIRSLLVEMRQQLPHLSTLVDIP